VRGAELPDRQAAEPLRHRRHPPQRDPRRRVQHAGHRRGYDAGDEAAGEAPDHDGASGRDGKHVGGQRRDGDATEHRHQDRCDADLRGDGDGQRVADRCRTGQPLGQVPAEQDDPQRRGDRELEARRAHEQRIDQHQRGDGEGKGTERRQRPSRRHSPGRDDRHRHRAKHGRFEASHHREEPEGQHDTGEPRPELQAAEHGSDRRQHERHVLAGDHEQVGQPRQAEVVDGLIALTAPITQHEPGEQGALVGVHHGRAPLEHPAQPVGGAGHHLTVVGDGDVVRHQAPHDVTGQQPLVVGLPRFDVRHDGDALPCQALTEHPPTSASCPQLEVASFGPHVGAHRTKRLGRVTHQFDHSSVPAGGSRPCAVDGLGRQRT
jgi:hypothetical protein